MKEIQTAKDAYVAADVLIEVVASLHGSHEDAIERAFEEVLGLSCGSPQAALDKVMTERAEAVAMFDPIAQRIAELEDALTKIRELAAPRTIRRNARIQALVARVMP